MGGIARFWTIVPAMAALAGCMAGPPGPLVDAQCRVVRVAAAAAAGRPAAPAELGGQPGNPPSVLTGAEIAAVADCLKPALDAALARADDATIRAAGASRPASRTYVASEHGMFLQVFANATGAGYLAYEKGGRLPQGTAIVKRSFRVAADGTSAPGPLFVMERMTSGYDASTNDWRFAATLPDGQLVGESGGRDAAKVAYCAGCHKSAHVQDFLFFVPPAFRY